MGYYKEKKNGSKNRNSASSDSKPATLAFNELRYVNLNLTAEEKEEFHSLLADGRFDAIPFDNWLENGYSFKLGISKDGKSVVATLTCSHREHVCAGGVLSAFAGDAATAIAVLRYKDEILSDELGWFAAEASRGGNKPDIG